MQEKLDFWDHCYGVDMGNIVDWVLHEPVIDNVPEQQIITNECVISKVDMYTVKVEDADFAASYKLKVKRNQAYL